MAGLVPRPLHTGRHARCSVFPCVVFVLLVCGAVGPACAVEPSGLQAGHVRDFSARLTWRTGGSTSLAQVFAKGDRYRIEHRAGIKTDVGYATVTIVRLDRHCVWYVLSRRRVVVEVPLTQDDVLPLSVTLEGEASRTRIGDAWVGDRAAVLYDVVVDRHGRRERYYQWVDEPRQVLLKVVSRDREWSVAYDRVILSGQPDYFFEPPLGYRTIHATLNTDG